MRKIVLLVTAFLTLTGLLLVFYGALGFSAEARKWFSVTHIWAGIAFLVVFTLYAWDHISLNRHWLKIPALVTFSGTFQTLSAIALSLTGIVLMLYASAAWETLRLIHHLLTYALAGSIGLHYISKK